MKYVFLALFILFAVMYVTAQLTLSRPQQDDKVHLRWSTDPNPARAEQTALFAKLNPGISVTVDPGLGGDQTKLIVQCATGTGPDIFDIGTAEQMASLAQAGILLDLTEPARAMGFSPADTYPSLANALLVDGRQYRFPCNVATNGVIYNKAVFDDHGVPYPKAGWTYDDLVRTCKLLQTNPSKSGQQHITVANWSSGAFVGDMMAGHGADFFTSDGLRSTLDSPEVIAAMRLYHDMTLVERAFPTLAELSTASSQGGWGSAIQIFSGGKAAMIFIGRWYIIQLRAFPELASQLGTVPLPRVGDRPSQGVVGTRAAGVNAKSPNKDQALKFLKYLAGPEYGRVIVEGGDALPPNPALARTGADLVNDQVADPAFHQAFIDAVEQGRTFNTSPFMDAVLVNRWFQERIDAVENGITSPEDAMRSLATEVNQTIRINLERRPDLRRKYEQVTGKKWTIDWWRT
ncbi:MAG: ABC transporter substrate-binding protein [Tepidisphaeraceae bacterium]